MKLLINLKVKDLSKKQLNKLIKVIEHLNIELINDLKKNLSFFIRSQRTHTNAKTSRKGFS